MNESQKEIIYVYVFELFVSPGTDVFDVKNQREDSVLLGRISKVYVLVDVFFFVFLIFIADSFILSKFVLFSPKYILLTLMYTIQNL